MNANHALYSRTGNWYHRLRRFPGAFFDSKGYVLFETENDFLNCDALNINIDVWVPRRISSIPTYVQVVIDGDEYVPPDDRSSTSERQRVYYEGDPVSVNLTRYERDQTARAKCLKYHGNCCCICGFDFGKTYGEIADGMIHVHHLISLADVRTRHSMDPIKDMRPICPNCHAVIHKREPAFTVDEVKHMLVNAKKGT